MSRKKKALVTAIASVIATGQIVVRNTSPTAFATSARQPIYMSFMYMID